MSRISGLVGFYEHGGIPRIAFPVNQFLGSLFGKAFPPNSIVCGIKSNVGEDSVLLCGSKSVEVRMLVCSGSNAEEAVFRVYCIKSAVGTYTHPSDIVADSPNLVSFFTKILGRNKHCKVGLAASGRERSRDVVNVALRIFKTEDKHVFRHPALFPTLVGSDSQRKALFAEKNVSAVSGVNGDNSIIFGELADISVFGVNVAFAVKTSYPVVAVAENFKNFRADSGHDSHIENNVNGVGYFNADFCKRRADGTHRIGDDIHCSAFITVACDVIKFFIHFFRVAPVVGRTCVFLFAGADECSVLNTRNVVGLCSVKIAAGKFLFIQFDHFTRCNGFRSEGVCLIFAAVYPNNVVGIGKILDFVKPCENGFVRCRHTYYLLFLNIFFFQNILFACFRNAATSKEMYVVTHIFHNNSIPQISTLFNIGFVNFCLRKIVKELTHDFRKPLQNANLRKTFTEKHSILYIRYAIII